MSFTTPATIWGPQVGGLIKQMLEISSRCQVDMFPNLHYDVEAPKKWKTGTSPSLGSPSAQTSTTPKRTGVDLGCTVASMQYSLNILVSDMTSRAGHFGHFLVLFPFCSLSPLSHWFLEAFRQESRESSRETVGTTSSRAAMSSPSSPPWILRFL